MRVATETSQATTEYHRTNKKGIRLQHAFSKGVAEPHNN